MLLFCFIRFVLSFQINVALFLALNRKTVAATSLLPLLFRIEEIIVVIRLRYVIQNLLQNNLLFLPSPDLFYQYDVLVSLFDNFCGPDQIVLQQLS